jgi:hypothetical protein
VEVETRKLLSLCCHVTPRLLDFQLLAHWLTIPKVTSFSRNLQSFLPQVPQFTDSVDTQIWLVWHSPKIHLRVQLARAGDCRGRCGCICLHTKYSHLLQAFYKGRKCWKALIQTQKKPPLTHPWPSKKNAYIFFQGAFNSNAFRVLAGSVNEWRGLAGNRHTGRLCATSKDSGTVTTSSQGGM